MKKLSLIFILIGAFVKAQTTPPVCFDISISNSVAATTISGSSVVKADFNGDGKLDLAVVGNQNLGVPIGVGDGTFLAGFNTFWTGEYVHYIVAADFNNDTKLDLALGVNDLTLTYGMIKIMIGNGTGSFVLGNTYTLSNIISNLTYADFDNNGNADLAVCFQTANSVKVLLGNGLGGLTFGSNFNVGNFPYHLRPDDFNNDGVKDLVVVNRSSNSISILIGTGTGSFSPAVNYTVGSSPTYVVSKDFNNDGNYDLAVTNYSSNNVSVLMGTGTGVFSTVVNYNSLVSKPYSITSDDFNGDGKLDLGIVAWNGYFLTMPGVGTGSFLPAAYIYTIGTTPSQIISADFNNDSKIDVVFSDLNNPSGVFKLLLNGVFLGINTTSTAVCLGNSVVLSGQGASTYTWSTGAITNSISISPTVTTNYTLTGMTFDGCLGSTVKTISVSVCAGLNENYENKNEINIYPNPTKGILNIESEKLNAPSTGSANNIKITNALGQVVYQSSINNEQSSINIQHLNNGIYFLQLFDKEQLIGTSKIIKE